MGGCEFLCPCHSYDWGAFRSLGVSVLCCACCVELGTEELLQREMSSKLPTGLTHRRLILRPSCILGSSYVESIIYALWLEPKSQAAAVSGFAMSSRLHHFAFDSRVL